MSIFLWDRQAGKVHGESLLFRCGKAGKLLRVPEKILRIYSPFSGREFAAGRDYLWQPGSREISRLPGSGIPEVEVLASPDTPGIIIYPESGCTHMPRCIGGKAVRLGPPSWYAEHRIEVDYITAETLPELPKILHFPERFIAKLRNREETVVSVVGDSITVGWNSTALFNCPPFGKPYIEQVIADLQQTFDTRIVLHNHAISGTGTVKGLELREKWESDHADLMVIAYGMNDYTRWSPGEYAGQILDIINAKKAIDPQAEFILVAPMPRNADWEPELYVPHGEYAGALHGIAACRSDCTVADVHRFWCAIQDAKDYYDLTGNGVNHANDYGQRIYAAVVRSCFPE